MHDGFTVHPYFVFSTSQNYILGYKTRKDIELKFYKSTALQMGTTITNENLIQEKLKRRLNSGNDYYHSVQNLLPSRLLSKNKN
jgi:hypothetical protein